MDGGGGGASETTVTPAEPAGPATPVVPPPARPYRRFSPLILIAAVIAGVMAGGVGANSVLRKPERYATRAILEIDQPQLVASAQNAGPVDKLNRLRQKYSLLGLTRRITSPVAQKTGLPEGLIGRGLSIGTPGESLLLVVNAVGNDPAQARTIADAVAEELVVFVKAEMEAAKIPETNRITLEVVAPAQPGFLFEPKRSRAITTGLLAGITALIGVVGVAESARAYRRRP